MADRRLTPARPDLAAKHLEGQVEAARFVAGEDCEIVAAIAALRQAPSPEAALETEALRGERITIYERDDDWAWGQLNSDGYVGYLPCNALGAIGAAPTHKVSALRTFAFPRPSIKLPPAMTLPLGALLAIVRDEDTFAVTPDGLFVPKQHLTLRDHVDGDFVAVAERFVGTPYLWGGKTSLGIDCSGLVQIALTACGVTCPRDSDMQQAALGRALTDSEAKYLQRGDLIFWTGHVAIVRDASTIVHANAHHMATAIEPTETAMSRIEAAGSRLISIRRL
jgi:hypothetical protein